MNQARKTNQTVAIYLRITGEGSKLSFSVSKAYKNWPSSTLYSIKREDITYFHFASYKFNSTNLIFFFTKEWNERTFKTEFKGSTPTNMYCMLTSASGSSKTLFSSILTVEKLMKYPNSCF